MKNIIYTGAFRFPEGDAAFSRVINNAKILKKLNYSVEFISWGGKYRNNDKVNNNYYYKNFKYTISNDIDRKDNLIKKIIYSILSGKNAIKIIKKELEEKKIEIIILYNTPLYFTLKIKSLCKKNKIMIISDITEWYIYKDFPGGLISPLYWISELNMRIIQKKIINKILISTYLNRYYKKTNNIIIPPLVDCEENKWGKVTCAKIPSLDLIKLIYAGNPKNKDCLKIIINAIIECLNEGKKIQFNILGIKKKEIGKYLDSQKLSIYKENIIFHGKIPQNMVPSYYANSDFSILIRKPNTKNMAGFPTKLVETLMSGCPVICNNTSDVGRYVENDYNGFIIDNWTIDKVKKIICKTSELPKNNIKTMKENARNSAEKYFSYNVYYNQMSNFLKSVI